MKTLSMDKKRNRNIKVLITAFFSIVLLAIAGTFYLQSFILKGEYVSANTEVTAANLATVGYQWTQNNNQGVDLAHCEYKQRNNPKDFKCKPTGTESWAKDIYVHRADWVRNRESGKECWRDGKKRYTDSPYFTSNSKVTSSKCSDIDDKLDDALDGNNGEPYKGWHYPTIFSYRVTVNGTKYQGYGYCTNDEDDHTSADENISKVQYRVVEVISDKTTDEGSCAKKRKVKARLQVYIVTKKNKQNVLSDWRNDGKYKRGSIVVTAEDETDDCDDCHVKEPDESKWPKCNGSNGPCCRTQTQNGGSATVSAEINEDTLFAGESVGSRFKVDIVPNDTYTEEPVITGDVEGGNYTEVTTEILPDRHELYESHFGIPSNYSASGNFSADSDATGFYGSGGPCSYISSRLGGMARECTSLSSASSLSPSGINTFASATAPDVISSSSSVGGKYCVAGVDNIIHRKKITTKTVSTWQESDPNNPDAEPVTKSETTITYDYPEETDSNTPASEIECRPIAKKPYFQVENSSIYSAGAVSSTMSQKRAGSSIAGGGTSKTFAPWSEYLLVTSSSIRNTASGATTNNGASGFSSICPTLSPLTIANVNCSSLGNSGITNTTFAEDIISYYSSDQRKDDVTRNVSNISSVSAFNGKNVIITDGNIDIGDNISADGGTFTSGSSVSQHIIISTSGDINISSNVGNIDAWLIAPNGTVNTCSDKDSDDPDYCGTQLVINGLVSAGNINFNRTHGIEYSSQAPAERIVFDPTAYLWSYQQASSKTGQANTVYLRELAPRQ